MITERPVRKTFPVNVMLEGRTALVVGGGRVGLRKVELLLDSGCAIRLVCPDCVPELTELSAAGRINHLPRDFEPSDLDGVSIVFACTDDRHANRTVLEAARAVKVPCCCADGNWADGDFVTPAIARSGDFLLAVSTNGRSCRQAKMMKNRLVRQLASWSGSDLLVVGTNHYLLDADIRAAFHLLPEDRVRVGGMIQQLRDIHEFFILNTCNRIEVVAATSNPEATAAAIGRLMRFDTLPSGGFIVKRGFDAFSHLCRVAAGLESQISGEFHVVSQLKDSLAESVANGWSGPVIHELGDEALRISKLIRNEVGQYLAVSEIEDVALRYLDEHIGANGNAPQVMVIGTGMVGRGVVKGLIKRGLRVVWVYHHQRPTLLPGTEIIPMSQIPERLGGVGAVVSAVSSPKPVVTAECGPFMNPGGVLMVDLGMPHNIAPEIAIGDRRLVDLDELKNWWRRKNGSMDRVEECCAAILGDNRYSYDRIRNSMNPAAGA